MTTTPKPSPAIMPARRAEHAVRPPSWNLGDADSGWYITTHALERAALKGYTEAQILATVRRPDVTYPRTDDPDQVRYIAGDICAVVRGGNLVVTVHAHKVETPKWDYQR